MKTIRVQTSGAYDVFIGTDLLSNAGEYIRNIHKPCKTAIISDSNVWPLYGQQVEQNLQIAGFSPVTFSFPAGEASKNAQTYLNILNFLAQQQVTRSDLVIALGGGVVGDITGFAAATFLRGISYVQVPTSLLAMVDSSVGGKTAIDLPVGKNLVGAFKQPSLVLCDISVLSSLPRELFLDGCAEIIKYAMLYDPQMMAYLEQTGTDFDREEVIAKCVGFKRDVVQEDEFDTGARQKLNLGHTIGHGIEAGSQFRIRHGQAVAAGMAIVTRAAVSTGLCNKDVADRLEKLLARFELPVSAAFRAEDLFTSALSDKKRSGGTVNLIVPRQVGFCEMIPTPVSELKSFIEAGLQ